MTSAQKLSTTPTEYLGRLVNGQLISYKGRTPVDLTNKRARGTLAEYKALTRQEHGKQFGLRIVALIGCCPDGSTIDLPIPDDWVRAPSVEVEKPANDEQVEGVSESTQEEPQDAQGVEVGKHPSEVVAPPITPDNLALEPNAESEPAPTVVTTLMVPDTPPLTNVTNAQFAQDMFGNRAQGTFCWTTAFTANPLEGKGKEWGGNKIQPDEIRDTPHGNAYVSAASLKYGADKTVKKDNQHFAALHLVILDDTTNAAIKPTYKLETSPDNYQLGFKLAEPITDAGIAGRLLQEIAKGDLKNDKSGNLAVRYVRLPVGCNTKAQPHFPCKLHAYDPAITYTLAQLIEAFKLNGEYILRGGKPANSTPPANSQTNNVVVIDDEIISDLRSALKALPADDRDPWAGKIGHALKTLGEVGRDLFMEWSKKAVGKFDQADADRVWESFKPTASGYRAVFAEAQKHGWVNPRSNAATGAGGVKQGASNPDDLASFVVDLSEKVSADSTHPHIIDQLVPEGEVSLLAGHGAAGKSYIALSLCIHVALGLNFGHLKVKRKKVLFFSAEDDKAELQRRVAKICRTLGAEQSELIDWLCLIDASEINPTLYEVTKRDEHLHTQILEKLDDFVRRCDLGLIVIDNASDVFNGNEIMRAHVRGFIRTLRQRLARPDRAVILLAHVSKVAAHNKRSQSAGTDEDYSGSTAWHNSVRSRMSLDTDDKGISTLKHLKANKGTKAEPIQFEWHSGAPTVAGTYESPGADVAETLLKSAEKKKDEAYKATIIEIIKDFDARGERVTTSMHGGVTVFKALSSSPEFPKGLMKDRLNSLMRELERDGQVLRVRRPTAYRKMVECFSCSREESESAPNAFTGTPKTIANQPEGST
jgi:archaellum biogenesis ATPase FlaH